MSLKTTPNDGSVKEFIGSVVDPEKRADAEVLLKLMKQITGSKPVMWGDSIVGFGKYHYVYASGREGDWFLTGFSPRKQNLTIYIMDGFSKYERQLKKLGKSKNSVSCLYVKRLSDIDIDVLEVILRESVADLKKKYS
ncbi:DUF1801 domain-containing protein [Fulvivirga sedimenti]|uniref:DUF1801 domain-containing protein n=1 Tax=Fulvivirga sedimenti TaxID=2879465 RepID=A0A9X1KVH9_9BACT|nr:DUF1801 domain-containing protein [Fulvivirga sedimenti]MCA6073700.1 DUF1801 domain-containing protein [Fulvivirga sedimenti]